MSLELLRFLFVGIGSNVVNFIIYSVAYKNGLSVFLASVAGYSSGLFVSYHFARIWVFGRKFNINKKTLFLFLIVYVIGGLGMSYIIEFLNKAHQLDYRACWVFGALFAVTNNFFGLKYLVFKKGKKNNGN